jgi:microcystin-dependent protein
VRGQPGAARPRRPPRGGGARRRARRPRAGARAPSPPPPPCLACPQDNAPTLTPTAAQATLPRATGPSATERETPRGPRARHSGHRPSAGSAQGPACARALARARAGPAPLGASPPPSAPAPSAAAALNATRPLPSARARRVLSIAANSALFSLLGTTFGGDGQTTFALPDLRGRVPIHQGQGPGLSSVVMGETAGVETVSLPVSQMPSHSHSFDTPSPVSFPATLPANTRVGRIPAASLQHSHTATATMSVTATPHSHDVTLPGHTHTVTSGSVQVRRRGGGTTRGRGGGGGSPGAPHQGPQAAGVGHSTVPGHCPTRPVPTHPTPPPDPSAARRPRRPCPTTSR